MSTSASTESEWSGWYPLSRTTSPSDVPDMPGVYEVRASLEIPRLKGKSRIVSIGSARVSLYMRLVEQRIGDPARYMNRAEKWLTVASQMLEFRYMTTASDEEAKYREAVRLFEYENEHWELPPGNDTLERAPIVRWIEGHHKPFNESVLRQLLQKHGAPEKVAYVLGVPPVVVENFRVYWLIG